MVWLVGKEDPRRAIHSLKVGLALTLVSFLYLLEPLFKGVGDNAIWAAITVVVVLEFTAGATLSKGLNRGLGTLLAGSLAFFVELMAGKAGKVGHAIFIGISVFLVGAASTYLRFFPWIKKNYDYGVVIFLLTFNLITISSYRIHDVLFIAQKRVCAMAIGCGLCLLMSLLVFPIWAGQDLHDTTVSKFQALAKSIQACVHEYFQDPDNKVVGAESSEDPIYNGYREVLDSKSTDESLARFASWEPRHCYRCPWQQYVQLGAALRYLAYTAVALHGCLESEIQTPLFLRALFKPQCTKVSEEISEVLADLADGIKNRCHRPYNDLSDRLHSALQSLNSTLKSQPRLFLNAEDGGVPLRLSHQRSSHCQGAAAANVSLPFLKIDEWRVKRVRSWSKDSDQRRMLRPTLSKIFMTSLEFSEALPFAAFASLLVEAVARLEHVMEEVEELGRSAHFQEFVANEETKSKVVINGDGGRSRGKLSSHGVGDSAE
ncbi:aluminum-activated malate transporter 12-like [Nymphaea colorata]|nr:aluminum-activated malate transporter 12-like [Nymphaea colorata]